VKTAIDAMCKCAVDSVDSDTDVIEWDAMAEVTAEQNTKKPPGADDADAYGEQQKKHKQTKKIKRSATLRNFLDGYTDEDGAKVPGYIEIAKTFFEHREIGHWQADEFNTCIDKLPEEHIAILIDFSMNYSHLHADEISGEHWYHHYDHYCSCCHCAISVTSHLLLLPLFIIVDCCSCRSHVQTTIIPVVVYRRDDEGVVNAHSIVYMSDDLNHSNNMVQHVVNDVLAKETGAGRKVGCAHVWSDGCAGQLKNKHQLYWLSEHPKGTPVIHNFSQSCHGKGPSDSEGAVVKSFLRRLAFVFDVRANDSLTAYQLCSGLHSRSSKQTGVSTDLGDLCSPKPKHTKHRHTIMSRCSRFVNAGAVCHLTRPNLDTVDGIKSHFCFYGVTGLRGELKMTQRSCYECEGCFTPTCKPACKRADYTGKEALVSMCCNRTAPPQTRSAKDALKKRLRKRVRGG
jgi:hypothetical protein